MMFKLERVEVAFDSRAKEFFGRLLAAESCLGICWDRLFILANDDGSSSSARAECMATRVTICTRNSLSRHRAREL